MQGPTGWHTMLLIYRLKEFSFPKKQLWFGFVDSVDKTNGGCYPYHLHVIFSGCLIEGNSYY